ncbi:MAG: NapC/NirT family cytochrome c [Magnetospirillum sp. WYHS-4]
MSDNSKLARLMRMRVLGAPLGAAAVFFVVGILFWGAYNTAMEATNSMPFCISCHEMDQAVYPEYQKTVHFQNRSGVRAICSDCHVPDPWVHKFVRKIQASLEIYHWLLGTVNTLDKFEAKRLTLAKKVWKNMKDTDSRECRNCHSWQAMTDSKQKQRAWKQHQNAQKDGMTCIDCHKGIAHRAVHTLLGENDNPYDGKSDPRRLDVTDPRAAMPAAAATTTDVPAPAPAPVTAPAVGGTSGGIDWNGVPGKDIALFFPGQTSIEWVSKGTDHGGARAFVKAGDRCTGCHEGEQAQMGAKMVSGEKAEDKAMVIPGKRAAITMNVKAANDGNNLLMRFQWPDTPHAPAPFVDGGKMDAANQTKLAVMLVPADKVEMAGQAGCWMTCHHDSRFMPDHPKSPAGDAAARLNLATGVTKYIRESRSAIETSNSPRGGWDKLKPAADIDALKKGGQAMDVVRYLSGGNKAEFGTVVEQRDLKPTDKVKFSGGLEGGNWVVTMIRPLKLDEPGALAIEPGKDYMVNFAIHDDYSFARFHHVSLEYQLGLDKADAQINAAKK